MASPMKILVVDDERVMRDLFKRVLTLKGYPVTAVESGKEAVEKVKEAEFDIAFVDIVMPEMDGVETFRAIKKVNANIHVVMMTGFAVENKMREAMQNGAIDYLYKPFDIAEIMTVIGKVEKKAKLKPLEE